MTSLKVRQASRQGLNRKIKVIDTFIQGATRHTMTETTIKGSRDVIKRVDRDRKEQSRNDESQDKPDISE